MGGYKGKLLLGVALAVLALPASPVAAQAQSASADAQLTLSIPAQRLSDALRDLAGVSGLQLIYDTRITDGKTSPSVSGTMTGRQALAALLAQSGLNSQFSDDRTVIITGRSSASGAPAEDGVRAVGVVSIEGHGGNMPFGELASPLNGVNGSRDVQSTEGSGSYTTGAASIATKVPRTLRETPQSVTVVTAQQLDDQSLVTFRDVLEKVPGVTVLNGASNEEFSFSSRGFDIYTFTLDGGAPISFAFNNRPVLDFSQFDSVQLSRGANGLFGGYGDPGGAINLVRKKPLDRRQISYEQDIGSWANFREELDVTGPIAADGKLRARFVLSRTDKEYFTDIAKSGKTSIYGVMDYELFSTTLLTVGGNYIREKNVPNLGGLPRYEDGGEIDWPRSTCLCVPFSRDRATRHELFGTLDHQFSDRISSRLNVTYQYQRVNGLYYNLTSLIYRGGSATGTLGGFSTDNPTKQLSFDFTTNGKFSLFGLEHELVVGASYQNIDDDGGQTTFYPGFQVPDVFNFDPSAYSEPPAPEPFVITIKNRVKTYGIYGNLRLQLFKNFHVSTGLRYSSYVDSAILKYEFNTEPSVPPKLRDRQLSRPNIGVTYDFLDNFTLYGNYQSTYQPQTDTRFTDTDFIPPPIKGLNQEVGLKWESPNRRLNASIAFYNIEQNGFLETDYSRPGTNTPVVKNIKSRGFDLEVAGELSRGLQVTLGYTYNKNEVQRETESPPNSSYTPHHILKAWATYRGQSGTPLERFIIGGGLYFQSRAYAQGFVCADPPSTDPNQPCSLFVPYEFATNGYATFGLKAGYRVTKNIELSVNVDNLTDVKTYGSSPGQNVVGYNYYIEPRNIVASLRAKW